MNLGAEPKKVAWLGGLLAIAAIALWYNTSGGASDDSSAPAPRRATVAAVVNPAPGTPLVPQRRQANSKGAVSEFKLRMGTRDPKDKPDPATIDPTLRLDLLAKVQEVEVGAPGRNIFQAGSAPDLKPIALPKVPKIDMTPRPVPQPQPVVNPGPPPPPQAPPMTFKYYGYTISKANGRKSAFLLDGEDIFIAAENDTVKRRYRVVKIGVNSITIEDTQFKSTQTLPLQENLAG